MSDSIIIKPQPGFQEKVALSKADVTIIGGAAGCGKSFIMQYLPLMYKEQKDFRATYFRRTQKMIREQGALWDESKKLYPHFDAHPLESILKWRFPSGAEIDFAGIEYEKDLANFQGAQLPYILFDELTHFTKEQFFFMLSRNRGACYNLPGCLRKPQVFASCNPDPDSWVALLVEWYINQETGYPIPEREGVLRYFIVMDDVIIWGDSKKELYHKYPDYFKSPEFIKSGIHPYSLIKSFTFIGGKIYDNKKLLAMNPGYLASLMAQSESNKERFLNGNWKIRTDNSGLYNIFSIDKIFKFKAPEISTLMSDKYGNLYRDKDYKNNYITCDAAKFGRDLCVIFVWYGFTIKAISIFYKSSTEDIFQEIEYLRNKWGILRDHVCVDQDGVGGYVVKKGGYYGFMARREVAVDPNMKRKENYKTRKDQCYFKSANRLNDGEIMCELDPTNIRIFDPGQDKPRNGLSIYWNKQMIPIKTMISRQLRAIKRGKSDFEGGVEKLCTNTKDEQKEILGHSPDFADNFMMREDFELTIKRKGKFGSH